MAGTQVARRGGIPNVTIEGATILFRNFSGKEGTYNREGDRNFALLLDPEDAANMERDGWNVKFLKPREDGDEPQPYIQVSVKFGQRPPRLVLITSRGRTNIDEEAAPILDWLDIENADVIIRPYEWSVNGKSGVKAYMQALYITAREDELERKYAHVPDSAQNVIGGGNLLQIEGARDDDEIIINEDGSIEGELVPW